MQLTLRIVITRQVFLSDTDQRFLPMLTSLCTEPVCRNVKIENTKQNIHLATFHFRFLQSNTFLLILVTESSNLDKSSVWIKLFYKCMRSSIFRRKTERKRDEDYWQVKHAIVGRYADNSNPEWASKPAGDSKSKGQTQYSGANNGDYDISHCLKLRTGSRRSQKRDPGASCVLLHFLPENLGSALDPSEIEVHCWIKNLRYTPHKSNKRN